MTCLCTGVSIRSHGKIRKFNFYINNVNSSGIISVIHLGSILIPIKLDKSMKDVSNSINLGIINVINNDNENINSTNTDNLDININNVRFDCSVSTDRPVSNTAVVEELINRVVLPSIYLSKEVTLKVDFLSQYVHRFIYEICKKLDHVFMYIYMFILHVLYISYMKYSNFA